MKKERTCQHPGCLAVISGDHLMCVTHWQRLPKEARQECQRRLMGWDSWDAAALWLEGYFKLEGKVVAQ
jgi:hypothetical protein